MNSGDDFRGIASCGEGRRAASVTAVPISPGGRAVTDFPTSNSRRAKPRRPGLAGPVIGAVLVFLWAFIFALRQSITTVTGTADMPRDLSLGVAVSLLGGLAGALIVGLGLYFVFGGRQASRGRMLAILLTAVAVVGAVPVAGFRVIGTGVAAEQAAIEAIRLRAKARSEAHEDRVWDERDALMRGGFMEPRSLAATGGVARARSKVKALRDMMVRVQVEDEALRREARAEVGRLPVSGPRRRQMLREFDASLDRDREATAISTQLTGMMLDEMDAMVDVLARSRWSLEDDNVAFWTDGDLAVFRLHARRLAEIQTEYDAAERQRLARS